MAFVDDTFPVENAFEKSVLNVQWKRPHEICNSPQLKESEIPSDAFQGAFNNCWLISASAALKIPIYWRQVFGVCKNTKLDCSVPGYRGKLVTFLWQNSKWNKVIIDDRLPVVKTQNKNFTCVGASCRNKNEFWAPLLEKACAKYFGSYEALNSGQVGSGFLLFTGALFYKQCLKPSEAKECDKLRSKIKFALSQNCLIFCSVRKCIVKSSAIQIEPNHYYTIANAESENVIISTTYEGFSKTLYPLVNLYMNSAEITFCFLKLKCLAPSCTDVEYSQTIFDKWKALATSGGNPNCSTYHQNPTYIFNFDLPSNEEQIIYVELTQTNSTSLYPKQSINMHVQVKNGKSLKMISSEMGYIFSKHISIVLPLKASDSRTFQVTVTPSTFDSNVNQSFMLRLISSFQLNQLL